MKKTIAALALAAALFTSCKKDNTYTVITIDYYLAGNDVIAGSSTPVIYKNAQQLYKLPSDAQINGICCQDGKIYTCGSTTEAEGTFPKIWENDQEYKITVPEGNGSFTKIMPLNIGNATIGQIGGKGILMLDKEVAFSYENKDGKPVTFDVIGINHEGYLAIGGKEGDTVAMWLLNYSSTSKNFEQRGEIIYPELSYTKYAYEITSLAASSNNTYLGLTCRDTETGLYSACYTYGTHDKTLKGGANGAKLAAMTYHNSNYNSYMIETGCVIDENGESKACYWSDESEEPQPFNLKDNIKNTEVFNSTSDAYGNLHVAIQSKELMQYYLFTSTNIQIVELKHPATFCPSDWTLAFRTETVSD